MKRRRADRDLERVLVDAYLARLRLAQVGTDAAKYVPRMIELAERLSGGDRDDLGRKAGAYSTAARIAQAEGRSEDASMLHRRLRRG